MLRASLMTQLIKNPPANTIDKRDMSLIPGSGRSHEEGNGHPLQYLAWKIPWTEESGRLLPTGSQRVRRD